MAPRATVASLTPIAGRALRPFIRPFGRALDVLVPAVVGSVLDRVDLTRVVVERVDLDEVARHLDLDAAARRLDLDAAAARIDVDAILDRIDLIGLAGYVIDGVDLAEIIRESTGSMASEGVREVRMQTIDADERFNRLIDRMLLRRHGRRTEGPIDVTGSLDGEMP